MYPLISSVFGLLLNSKLVLVLISFLSFLGIIILIRRVLRVLFANIENENTLNLFVFITLVLSPYFFRASLVGMSDMLACFFVVASFYGLLNYNSLKLTKWAIWTAGFAIAAVMTRYVSALLILPMAIQFIYALLKNRNWKALFISILVVGIIVLPHLIIRGAGSMAFLSHSFLTSWSPSNFFQSQFATSEGTMSHAYPNFLIGLSPFFHPGYLLIGLGCLIFVRFKNLSKSQWYLVAMIVLYLVFVGGMSVQNMRFFIIVFPFCTMLFYPAFIRGKEKLPKWLFMLGFASAMLIQVGYFSLSFSKFQVHHQLEKAVATF